jgi:mycothiol S-conjugate amidase
LSEPLRLMCVHAHPDDESSKGAGTMARYVAEGAEVLVVSCTGGERGDVLNPALKDDAALLRDMPEVRRREMAEAVRILGVQHEWLGFVDSGLPEGDPLPPLPEGCFALEPLPTATEPLVRLIRAFRPHVMTTYDENGGYPHPDHIMCHKVSVAAFDVSGDPGRHPELGEPWQPLKLYYNSGWTRARMIALHEGMLAAGLESPYTEWIAKWEDRHDRGDKITTRVECGDYFEVRDNALRAHATQVDPDGFWFHVPMDLQIKIWPTEDFELVRSMVDSPVPESDLFAGVRESVQAR